MKYKDLQFFFFYFIESKLWLLRKYLYSMFYFLFFDDIEACIFSLLIPVFTLMNDNLSSDQALTLHHN